MTRVQKERANAINAVKVFSLGKGKISKYMVFFHLRERKGHTPFTERHKPPSPTQKADWKLCSHTGASSKLGCYGQTGVLDAQPTLEQLKPPPGCNSCWLLSSVFHYVNMPVWKTMAVQELIHKFFSDPCWMERDSLQRLGYTARHTS